MDISILLRSSEGKTLEFKSNSLSPNGLLKTLIAFANTAGGTLMIGVEDKTKTVCGVKDPLLEEERLVNLISDHICPRLVPNIEISTWRNAYLVIVQVYPSNSRPHYLKKEGIEKGCFVRVGSTNRLADASMISELRRSVVHSSFDEQPMPELNSEALDFRLASELFSEHRQLKATDLETLKLVASHQNRIVPTVGGILLFGKERERYFPDAWIQLGRFSGDNKKTILDTKEIHASPIPAIEDAIQFVKKHSAQSVEIGAITGTKRWSVPMVAIREAVINALVHADYSQRGAPIRISIFDNRLEIENPGLIPYNLVLEDLYRGVSKLRNPVIGRVFFELKLIEQWGSGIRRMIEACREAGFDAPLFEEVGIHFRVTLWTTPKHPPTLDESEQLLLAQFKDGKGLSTAQIATMVGLSTRATRTRLISLISRGLIVEIGTGPKDPKRKYYLAAK